MNKIKSLVLVFLIGVLFLTACGKPGAKTISMEEAVEIALLELDLNVYDVEFVKKEYDQDDKEYDIEFLYDGKEYEFKISSDGKILEKDVDRKLNLKMADSPVVNLDRAFEIALEDQGLTEDQITITKKYEDLEDGDFEIEYIYNGKEYKYEIDNRGRIKELDIDRADKNPEGQELISISEARDIALKDAGFTESDVLDLEVVLEEERGKFIYEVSFEKDNKEYDYDIDAVNGEIIKKEIDR